MSEYLAVRKVPVTACVATEYGETLLKETEYLKVHAGRMEEAAMEQFFEEQKTELVVDATHPYAAVVSENVAAACKKAGVEYLRLIRESSTSETEDAILVDSVDEAVNFLKETEGNILATTGSKELFKYTVQGCCPLRKWHQPVKNWDLWDEISSVCRDPSARH